MPVVEETSVLWAVLDAASEVVVLCSGSDAPAFLDDWRRSGYRIVALDAGEVTVS